MEKMGWRFSRNSRKDLAGSGELSNNLPLFLPQAAGNGPVQKDFPRAGHPGFFRGRAGDPHSQPDAMTRTELVDLLTRIRDGKLTPEEAIGQVERKTFQDLGFAKPDHQRAERLGFPEVVFAEGKEDGHLLDICRAHLSLHDRLLVTRLEAGRASLLTEALPEGHYAPTARTLSYGLAGIQPVGNVQVFCAGTSDLPVAGEALETARIMGARVELTADVGVAGIHRLMRVSKSTNSVRVMVYHRPIVDFQYESHRHPPINHWGFSGFRIWRLHCRAMDGPHQGHFRPGFGQGNHAADIAQGVLAGLVFRITMEGDQIGAQPEAGDQLRPGVPGDGDRLPHVIGMPMGQQDVVHPFQLFQRILVWILGVPEPGIDQDHASRRGFHLERGVTVPGDLDLLGRMRGRQGYGQENGGKKEGGKQRAHE